MARGNVEKNGNKASKTVKYKQGIDEKMWGNESRGTIADKTDPMRKLVKSKEAPHTTMLSEPHPY